MNKIKTLLASTVALGVAITANANLMNINTPFGYNSLDASGSALFGSTAGPWTFSLGSFADGFTPGSDNLASWSANYTVAFNATLIAAGPPTQIGRLNSTQALQEASLLNQQGYIFGYNSLDVTGSSQWILLTNNAWVFPAEIDPLATSPIATWSPADVGTVALFGSVSQEGMQFQAVPEPSTYALIFGLGILGFLGYRRVRK